MRLLPSALFVCALTLSLTGISRDGTLPARMSGVSFPVPNHTGQLLQTEIRLFQTQPPPGIPFTCGLRGSEIHSTSIRGALDVGEQTFSVIGTCFNPATNTVELITSRPDTRLQGRISGSTTIDLKGVIKLQEQTLKVELK